MSFYGEMEDAVDYFENERFDSEAWDDASESDRTVALTHATNAIDNLNLIGTKAVSTQVLQFPRLGQTAVPRAVLIATWESALALLDGVNIEEELNGVQIVSERISDAATTYDRNFALAHFNAGIPSATAWRYIQRYVSKSRSLRLHRV